MRRFLADENFKVAIIRGLTARTPQIEIVTAAQAGLLGADDSTVLAWAASEHRVLLTHDAETMLDFAYERLASGLHVPGLVLVPWRLPVGRTIEDLLILIDASRDDEWGANFHYLPF